MALKLMYITNRPDVAQIAESVGVDRIFVDMEYIGKSDRQGGMNTVQNHHAVKDVNRIREVLSKSELLVRVNPIHEASVDYDSSQDEINAVIEAGADVVMLPFFKTAGEVKKFIECVNGRARTLLLFETPESIMNLDDILALSGIDEVFVGLNDLSLGYGKSFMFELLADGTVEQICQRFKQKGVPFGFGGIAALGKGMLPAEYIISEHYRTGSTCAILSRSFCNVDQIGDIGEIRNIFTNGVRDIREFESTCENLSQPFEENQKEVRRRVDIILESIMTHRDGK